MCGPVALVAGAAALGAVKAAGEQKAANEAAEYNARIAERNAQVAELQAAQALEKGRADELRARRQVSVLKGTQRAGFGASGALVDTGSTLDVLADTAGTGELDALNIQFNAKNEAFGAREKAVSYTTQAALSRSQTRSPFSAGFGSLLGSAGTVAAVSAARK